MTEARGARIPTHLEGCISPWTRRAERQGIAASQAQLEMARSLIRRITQSEAFASSQQSLTASLPGQWQEGLMAAEAERLELAWGNPALAELNSLSRESDLDILGSSLLVFSQRRIQEGQVEPALRTLNILVQSEEIPDSIRSQAREQLQAMAGTGGAGLRAEFLLGHLAQETLDPATLVAMGLATTTFRVARLWSLGALSNGGLRLWEANALSRLLAFGVEAPVFALSAKLGHTLMGRAENWGSSDLGREILSSYLVLGAMKLTGAAAQAGLEWQAGSSLSLTSSNLSRFQKFSQSFLPQAAMLSGIFLGHGLEQGFGLRPAQDRTTTLVESLALLLQFNWAGHVSQRLLGPGFAHWELEMDARTRLLLEKPSNSWPPNFGPGLALAEGSTLAVEPSRLDGNRPLAMAALEDKGGGGIPPAQDPILSHVEVLFDRFSASSSDLGAATRQRGARRFRTLLAKPETHSDVLETLLGVEEGRHPEVNLPELLFAMGLEGKPESSAEEIWWILQGRLDPGREVLHFYRGLDGIETKVWNLAHWLMERIPNRERLAGLQSFADELKNSSVNQDFKRQTSKILALLKTEPAREIRVSSEVLKELVDIFRNTSMSHMFFSDEPDGAAAQFAQIHKTLLHLEIPRKVVANMSRTGSNHVAFEKNPKNILWLARFFRSENIIQGRSEVNRHLAETPRGFAIPNTLREYKAVDPSSGLPFYFPESFRALTSRANESPEASSILNRFKLKRGIARLDRALKEGQASRWDDVIEEITRDPNLSHRLLREISERGIPTTESISEEALRPLSPLDKNINYPPELNSLLDQSKVRLQDPAYFEGSREELLAKRMSLEEMDRLILYQAIDHGRRIPGAQVKILDAGELLREDPAGFSMKDPSLIRRALATLGAQSAKGSSARTMVEIRVPQQFLLAEGEDPKLEWLGVFPTLSYAQKKLNYSVQLLLEDDNFARFRIPSASLMEALTLAVHGEAAPRIFGVWGEIPRDQSMRLRSSRLTPTGYAIQAIHLGDAEKETHPSAFTGHDLFFHFPRDAGVSQEQLDTLAGLYRDFQKWIPATAIKEDLLDKLADLEIDNFGSNEGDNWASLVISPVYHCISGLSPKTAHLEDIAKMHESEIYLQALGTWIQEGLPSHPELLPLKATFEEQLRNAGHSLGLHKIPLDPP